MTRNSIQSPLWDVTQAAAFLHIKPPTLFVWIARKRVPFVRLGRRVFLRKNDLDALVAGKLTVK